MMTFYLLYFLLTILPIAFCQNCVLPYTDFPSKEPVFLKTDLNLIEPNISAIEFQPNEEFYLACPGSKNYLLQTSTPLEKASCVQNTTLKIRTQNYNLSAINCTNAVTGEYMVSTEICGNGRGVIKIIGYNITGQFDKLIRVCYDNTKGEAIYSEHTLYGSAINFAKKESSRPSFKVGGVASGINADDAYKQTTQKTTFTNILQSTTLANYYITTSSYLARGHLSPDGDFIFVSSQFSSYFYINTMPQWQAINNGNWKAVETSIRSTAANYGNQFKILTGGYDVLSLNDTYGVPQSIYLSSSRLPVPKFTWKVAQDLESMDAIAFVTLNNPFVAGVKASDLLCVDICEAFGWDNVAFGNTAKGYTYCCDVNQLRSIVTTIPVVSYNNILAKI